MLQTSLCRQLGIEYPIFSVGFGAAARPELAAAVSNAGGCGVLGTSGSPLPYIREQIQRLRTLTRKPFGVNVILAIMREGTIEACLDEHVPLLVLFWGDPAPYVTEAHRRGTKVFIQVGSVDEARAAADAGVDAVIAQGVEAGGHVKGRISLSTLLPAVVEAVKPRRPTQPETNRKDH
jgi:nitronate monooxygenase